VIDIDVLLYGQLVFGSERLVLPHPGVLERRFVLEPLLELDPDLQLPGGARLADRLVATAGQDVRVVGPPLV
jgi:7,8-dihydro-6-hydroxymethylpterin-pyrophosphokinase